MANMDDIAQKLRNNGSWVNWETASQRHWAPLDERDRHLAAAEIERLTAALRVFVEASGPECDLPQGLMREALIDAARILDEPSHERPSDPRRA